MALSFSFRSKVPTIPVELDGVTYGARVGSSKAVDALNRLAKAMGALGGFAKADKVDVDGALKAIEALDAPLREAVSELFGADAVAGIVGEGPADIVTATEVTQMLTAVINSDEYLSSTLAYVSARAKTAGKD